MWQTESLHVGDPILENTLKSLTILVIISGQEQVLEDTIQNEYFGGFTNQRETILHCRVQHGPSLTHLAPHAASAVNEAVRVEVGVWSPLD